MCTMGKMTRCYTCGYEELILSRVVYCVSCEEAMVHRYCIDRPRHGDEEFDWVCEICCPREYNRPKSRRTNEHLCSKLDSESEKRKPRRRLIKLGDKSHGHQEDSKKHLGGRLEEFVEELESLPTPEDFYYDQPIGDVEVAVGLRTNRTTQKQGSADFDRNRCSSQKFNGTHEGRGRSLMDQDPMNCPPLQKPETDVRCDSNFPQSENLSSSPPVRSSSLMHKDVNNSLPISWRGTCRVTSKMHGVSVELVAHLSNMANHKVFEAAVTLPFPLDLKLVGKLSELPKRFSKVPPSDSDIGLYFFPFEACDRKAYDHLLGMMAVNDLILSFTSSDLRLLVFSSLGLPKRTQRFGGKLYLWGFFFASLSLPSTEKVSSCRPLLLSHSKGGSCLKEDPPSNRRSCTPTGEEAQSIRKGRGSSDTIQPTQQNARSNDQRDSGRPLSLLLRPVSLPNRTDPRKHGHGASGGKDSAFVRKRKRGEDKSPDQRKLDATGNPANNCKRIFNRLEKETFKQQYKQNSGYFSGAKQKRKNKQKQKQKQKQCHSPHKKRSPLLKAPKPGSPKSDGHLEPHTISSGAEHSVANGSICMDQSAQSNQHPSQAPCFSQHEMSINKNWSQHSHLQSCAGFLGGQHAMPVTCQLHPQPHPCFLGGQHPMPVTGHPHPMQYAGFPGGQLPTLPGYPCGQHPMPLGCPSGQHPMPVAGQSHHQQCAGLPGGQHPKPPGRPSGQHSMLVAGQSHPQQCAGLPGGQHPMPPGCSGRQHPMPVAGQSHPQQCAGLLGGQHPMPPGCSRGQDSMSVAGQSHPQQCAGFSGGQHTIPVARQSHPQQCAGFSGCQHTMPPGYLGGQHPMPVAGQPRPQQSGGFSGGQHTMPAAGHWQPQPYVGFPGCQHGMPMHPQPHANIRGSQQAMWPPHPRPHANFPGGQQSAPVVGSEGSCS